MADLNMFFKGIIDIDEKAIVICNLSHTIIYMNPAAEKQYEKSGGGALVGHSIFDCHNPHSKEIILKNINAMKADKLLNKIFEFHKDRNGCNDDVYCQAIRDENGELIGYYEKFEDKNLYAEQGEMNV
ncbi:MAG: PAS domain-containing protein [Ruminococcus sp.]|nr:PAS domain-containing protein [Ruminococcus sp.]